VMLHRSSVFAVLRCGGIPVGGLTSLRSRLYWL
jgi:hypothetical protein